MSLEILICGRYIFLAGKACVLVEDMPAGERNCLPYGGTRETKRECSREFLMPSRFFYFPY